VVGAGGERVPSRASSTLRAMPRRSSISRPSGRVSSPPWPLPRCPPLSHAGRRMSDRRASYARRASFARPAAAGPVPAHPLQGTAATPVPSRAMRRCAGAAAVPTRVFHEPLFTTGVVVPSGNIMTTFPRVRAVPPSDCDGVVLPPRFAPKRPPAPSSSVERNSYRSGLADEASPVSAERHAHRHGRRSKQVVCMRDAAAPPEFFCPFRWTGAGTRPEPGPR